MDEGLRAVPFCESGPRAWAWRHAGSGSASNPASPQLLDLTRKSFEHEYSVKGSLTSLRCCLSLRVHSECGKLIGVSIERRKHFALVARMRMYGHAASDYSHFWDLLSGYAKHMCYFKRDRKLYRIVIAHLHAQIGLKCRYSVVLAAGCEQSGAGPLYLMRTCVYMCTFFTVRQRLALRGCAQYKRYLQS